VQPKVQGAFFTNAIVARFLTYIAPVFSGNAANYSIVRPTAALQINAIGEGECSDVATAAQDLSTVMLRSWLTGSMCVCIGTG